jgi:Ni,Fe-hydrogenase III large subunit
VANDERMLEDGVFKLYYVLSNPADQAGQHDQVIILEHPLKPGPPYEFASIRDVFGAAQRLEDEAFDLYGLAPTNATRCAGRLLHESFPRDLYPLRQNRSQSSLHERIAKGQATPTRGAARLPHGILNLIVGPIHAGVIQAGQFRFHVAGEIIEDLDIRLGYTHRGIEKLFATHYTLETGHTLAERVAGDNSVAHALAYCRAVEDLVDIPGVIPPAAIYWRDLLLELERIYNHIGDVAALLHDIAFDLVASEIAVLRERIVRLNAALTDHRLLRGAIHPGGVAIRRPEESLEVLTELAQIVEQYLVLVDRLVLANPSCRARAISTGILTETEAKELGATGLPARASGLWEHDFRLRHPQAAYAAPEIGHELRTLIRQTFTGFSEAVSVSPARRIQVLRDDLRGDVFARLLLRAAEVETSVQLIGLLADALARLGAKAMLTDRETLNSALKSTPNFEIGLGYAEGWRGDVFYFIMKGPGNTIFRCQVRDPSLYNWPALRQAVIRKPRERQSGGDSKAPLQFWENILADFPLINKSFNLSYAGNDR